MTAQVLPLAIAMLAVAMLLTLWRLLRGPGIPDRILALDTLYINALALLVLLGIQFRTALLFETALIIAMLGFVGTVAMSKYLLRGDIVE
ncbi:K+/H+ antiporter subunit F [Quisquiliibacterium transsilvanicum]|jgi:multicomponent K+:H+ antiporter subunit F|uniref:Multicomponent K+:H+ antiporter subunit F n=1 Tax=Quisquiliibacterium transsilvanicum TaxID=1549638 RepID=A0A7W8HE30_9BURK|nr:K+/H+ antiporter subunit F [Quisquiliibacterium transsilvanicum]MBB5270354.1 multicomponent K+:H+ antiporter subunit F [Quisquiliibacterium transsilvanicum]